jgi:hypothetical protein
MDSIGELLQGLFLRVAQISLQALPLVLLILVAQHLLKDRISVRMRHVLWGVLLIRLLLLWTIPTPFSFYNLAQRVTLPEETPSIQTVIDSVIRPAVTRTLGPDSVVLNDHFPRILFFGRRSAITA